MPVDEDIFGKKDWDNLVWRIKRGACTPFIGAGACYPYLPLGGKLASDWAENYGYPLKDSTDLPKVAQFMAIDNFDMFPKYRIAEEFENRIKESSPDFSKRDNPHGILADLNLPIYITTNYDNFMFNALKTRQKDPERELCRWSNEVEQMLKLKQIKPILDPKTSSYKPSANKPLVYHLHGYLEIPESLVLTESDYLDFMIRLHQPENPVLHPEITIALATNALLFIGYSLADWNFRVLFRALFSALRSMTNLIIAVQLRPKDVKNETDAVKYLGKYFGSILAGSSHLQVRVYWGEAADFAKELREHWETGISAK
jgi:hypothetical protein